MICTYHSGSSPYDPNHQEEYPSDPEDDGSGIDNGDPDTGDDEMDNDTSGDDNRDDGLDPTQPEEDDGFPTE